MTATLQKPPRKRAKAFDPDFRFTVAQYQQMTADGIFPADARIELLRGKVVNKMSRNPPHDVTLCVTQEELKPICTPEWVIRAQMAVVIGKSNQPEPDLAVVLAPFKRYLRQHPQPKEIGMLVEIADSTLLQDRRDKAPIYAGGRIPWYWIVNVADKVVEVYSDPKSGAAPAYRKQRDYNMGESVPVVLTGKTVGYVEVGRLFPEAAD